MANPKIFGIISLVILLISGFVATKNKAAYALEIENTAKEAERLKISEARLKKAQDNLKASQEQCAQTRDSIASLSRDEEAQKKTNQELKSDYEQKQAKLAELQGGAADAAQMMQELATMQQSADKLALLAGEIEQLTQAVTQTETKLNDLTAKKQGVEQEVKILNENLEARRGGRSLNSLKTHIQSVYPSWGFVTLAAGDADGVVMASTLNVIRAGKVVAKLLVTAVETNSASATVIPAAKGEQVDVMPGDEVLPAQIKLADAEDAPPADAAGALPVEVPVPALP